MTKERYRIDRDYRWSAWRVVDTKTGRSIGRYKKIARAERHTAFMNTPEVSNG